MNGRLEKELKAEEKMKYKFIFIDEEKITDDINGLRVFLIFSFVLQLFSTIHYTAMRFNYYFLLTSCYLKICSFSI